MKIRNILEKIKSEGIELKPDYTPFNMVHILYNKFHQRENIHDLLLGGLLNPHENHGFGYLLLNEFIKAIKIENVTLDKNNSVYVKRSRYVNVVNSSRPIDIFVSWKDNIGKKCAIIIENKLHGAIDQPDQIKDYYEGIACIIHKQIKKSS